MCIRSVFSIGCIEARKTLFIRDKTPCSKRKKGKTF